MGFENLGSAQAKSASVDRDEAPASPLVKRARENGGEEVYYDPFNFTKGKQGVDKRAEIHEQEGIDKLQEKVSHISEARDPYAASIKAMDTTQFSIPVFTNPEFEFSDIKHLPVARGLARVAVDEIELQYDEVDDVGTLSSSTAEGGTFPSVGDDGITQHDYTIDRAVGVKSEVSDLAQIAANQRSPRQYREQIHQLRIERYMENQALQGTSNDANNYEGIDDYARGSLGTVISNSTKNAKERVRDVITELDQRGTAPSDGMIVVDHDFYRDLKDVLDDTERKNDLPEDNNFGIRFEGLELDDYMVVRSHGAASGKIYGFDASLTRFAMAEDLTQKPLAPSDTGENFATYNYHTLVSNGQRRSIVAE
jgi:hypothetical protein